MLCLHHVLILSKMHHHIFLYGPSVKAKLSVTDFLHRTGIHLVTPGFCTKHLEGVCEFWKPLPSLREDFLNSYVMKSATATLLIIRYNFFTQPIAAGMRFCNPKTDGYVPFQPSSASPQAPFAYYC
jgi:hypothetical protein